MSKKTASASTEAHRLPPSPPWLKHHLCTLEPLMQEWKKANHIPPSLLLTGVSGLGKKTLATYLAQWLLCEKTGWSKPPEEEGEQDGFFGGGLLASTPAPTEISALPCGQCRHCKNAISGTWVDFTEIESDSDTGSLKIEQFRNLRAGAGFGAHDGPFKIILVPDADRMTAQAANSILKLLEEPPKSWLFFLTASDPTLVLPTVLSRCQTVRLKPLHAAVLEQILTTQEAEPKRIPIAAKLAQGSLGKAMHLCSDDTWESREHVLRFVERPSQEMSTLLDWAALEPNRLDLVADQLESVCSDLLQLQLNNEAHLLNADSTASFKRVLANNTKRSLWIGHASEIAHFRALSHTPMNKKLLLQNLLSPWLLHT